MHEIKNILIIAPSLSVKMGGITTSVLNYYDALIEHMDITVATTVLPDETVTINECIVQNKDFLLFPSTDPKWRYSKHLNLFLKKNIHQYDLVWTHGIWLSQSFFTFLYARKFKIPYIVTIHGFLNPFSIKQKYLKKKIYWYLIEKHILKNASAIHCLTKSEERTVKKVLDVNTFVVPNTIDVGMFQEKFYGNPKYVCFVGRFEHRKGLDLLLEALSGVEDIHLLIAGDGEKAYESYIYSLVEQYNLASRVTFLGFADNAMRKDIFAKSLFCVIPSYSEGLAMVGLEAIAYSTPVIATLQCDFEIIDDYDAGIVIENNQPEIIIEGIKEMMTKDSEQMSKNAYLLAKEQFNLDVVGKRLVEVFISKFKN